MPTFEIPDGPTTIDLERSGDAQNPGPATGSIVFNVTNKSADSCAGRLSVIPSGSAKAEWFTLDGDRERTFAAGETQTAKINISAPKDVAAGDYPFRLRAVAVNDPDNDHVEGPVATAKVPPPAAPQKKSLWWLWLLIALLVLALIGGGVWFAFFRDKGPDPSKTVAAPDFMANGMTIEAAKKDPKGFKIVEVPGEATGKPIGTIVGQDPAPTAPATPGQDIKLTFDPGAVVPPLPQNATLVSAANVLRSAKLQPGQHLCDSSSGKPGAQVGKVTTFVPATGARLAANTPVMMRLVQASACPPLRLRRRVDVTAIPIRRVP